MQDLIFLTKPSSFYSNNPDDISWKATKLVMNRFTIEEDAAFELLGVADERGMNQLSLNGIDQTRNLHIIHVQGFQDTLYTNQILEKCQARSAMVTLMYMCRHFLITKEKMEDICKGQGRLKQSANDDIEALFADLQLGNEPRSYSNTYFLPKLTHKEKQLVEKRDSNYLKTFSLLNPYIDENEMKMSESKSMYVRAWCTRETYIMENPIIQEENVSNVLSDRIPIEANTIISNQNNDDDRFPDAYASRIPSDHIQAEIISLTTTYSQDDLYPDEDVSKISSDHRYNRYKKFMTDINSLIVNLDDVHIEKNQRKCYKISKCCPTKKCCFDTYYYLVIYPLAFIIFALIFVLREIWE